MCVQSISEYNSTGPYAEPRRRQLLTQLRRVVLNVVKTTLTNLHQTRTTLDGLTGYLHYTYNTHSHIHIHTHSPLGTASIRAPRRVARSHQLREIAITSGY